MLASKSSTILALALAWVGALPTAAATLEYVGTQSVATGTMMGGAEFGGLSGLSYNPHTDRFVAVTDDSRAAGSSRVWTMDLAYTGVDFSSVAIESSVALKTASGGVLPTADAEGLAANLDGSCYVSHEGLASGLDPIESVPPWIARFDFLTGNKLASVALPVKFLPRDSGGQPVAPDAATQVSGVRSNLSLESLGLTPTRKVFFAANEAALKQDYSGVFNDTVNQAQNSEVRIVRLPGAPGSPAAAEEKVYRSDLGTMYVFVRRFNTVSDLLPLDDSGRMLVLERGLTDNNLNLGSYRIRIYEVDFNQPTATDVSGVPALVGAGYTVLDKTLRWESSTNMDNVEGLCFGRDVDGFRTIVLVSDNNFSAAQTTQFHVLRTDVPAVSRRTLSASSVGQGSIFASPALAWYPDGSEVSLLATPAPAHTFIGWSGSLSDMVNPSLLVMDADHAVQAAFQTSFAVWQGGYFQPLDPAGAEDGDPDGDRLPNFLEYALGLHPGQPSVEGLPVLGKDGAVLTLTYHKDPSRTDVAYQVEVSDALSSWDPVSDVLVGMEGAVEIRRASVPAGPTSRFLRLKVRRLF